MPDTKITALTAIGANPIIPATFPIPMVDLTDTSMAASGTTKKVTVNQILGAGGTATLASATITGDLTVDTSTLKVDSTNNRVIVGHTSGSSAFQVTNAGAAGLEIQPTGFSSSPLILSYNRSGSAYTQLTLDGSTIVHALSGSTAMTLNSTGLGVGGSPSYKLDVAGPVMRLINSAATADFFLTDSGTTNGNVRLRGESNAMKFITGGGVSATIDSSGNVGIGVTPSAWSSTWKAIQVGAIGSLSYSPDDTGYTISTSNGYWNGSNWIRIAAAAVSAYSQNQGKHSWLSAASSSAGSTIAFGDAKMTLDASGNLLVGTTTMPSGVTLARLVAKSNLSDWSGVIWNSNAIPYGFRIQHDTDSNGTGNEFLYCLGAANLRASIRSNGGIANYQANDVSLSDSRMKSDIKPLGSYWNKIKSLEIVTFKYNDQTHSDDNIGLIAQQVESVAPELVDVDGFGETPTDGVPLKTIYTTDLYHAAIKALQEAMARIEVLEAKLA